MENKSIMSELLEKLLLYPINNEPLDGVGLNLKTDDRNRLLLSGSANDLIELADLLVALALSGKNEGQHWHIDKNTLIGEKSIISEIIMMRNDK